MLTITYGDYRINLNQNGCSLSVVRKDERQRIKLSAKGKESTLMIGHFNTLADAIQKAIEHRLNQKTETRTLESYLKEYQDTSNKILNILK